MQLLPHRYPFLLVDAVLECVPGSYILGAKNITKNEPNVRHGESMSHLLVIESLAQLSVILAFKTLDLSPASDVLTVFAGIDDAQFGSPPSCGSRVVMRSEVIKIRKMMGWFRANASVDGDRVIDVRMIAAIRTRGTA
jgi:3-hydroxyacyl-[acyl-carrier-protein] dehydratase